MFLAYQQRVIMNLGDGYELRYLVLCRECKINRVS